MSQVENQIGTVRNTNDMLRVFSKFNMLLLGQGYMLSLPIVIFLLNNTRVDSWFDTEALDSTCRFGKNGH